MTNDSDRRLPTVDNAGMVIGLAVGVPAAIGVGALMAVFRPLFDTTNAALVLMIVVVGGLSAVLGYLMRGH